MSRGTSSYSGISVLVLLLGTVFVVYYVGLSGPFVFDDKPNLLDNPFIQLTSLDIDSLRTAALSYKGSLFGRPIASLSFAGNFYLAGGFSEFQFKLTNLLIHAVNGLLVFLLARQVTTRLTTGNESVSPASIANLVPVVVAGLWLLHPLQLTSVLYVVQRMNSLSALFVFLGLLVFFHGRVRFEQNRSGGIVLMAVGIIAGTGLGVLCKENAALLPILAGVVELSCFSFQMLNHSRQRTLRIFYWTLIGVPVLWALYFLATHPGTVIGSYYARTFSWYERVLTQPRVLFYYLRLIFVPLRQDLGLFHDDFELSTGIMSPPTTAVAIISWIVVVATAVRFRRCAPAYFFTIAWFLTGHAMESSIFGLELVHEHRNYLPLFGMILGPAYYAISILEKAIRSRKIIYGVFGIAALTIGFVTHSRAYTWSSHQLMMETMVKHRPSSPRAVGYFAEVALHTYGDLETAFELQQRYTRLLPSSVNGLIQMLLILEIAKPTNTGPVEQQLSEQGSESVLHTRFPNGLSENLRLKEEITEEIILRLKTEQITASTVSTFGTLVGCLYTAQPVCVSLASDMAKWIDAALGNPSMAGAHRSSMFLYGSKIHGWHGNLHKALIYARFAKEAGGERIQTLIQLGELYYALGQYGLALAQLDLLKRMEGLVSLDANAVQNLDERLEEKFKHLKTPASGTEN